MPVAICIPMGDVAQWYTYRPGFRVLKEKVFSLPGATKEDSAPPPGPVTACKSMLCGNLLFGWFFRVNSTSSPTRVLIKSPGTVPPKVQYIYRTPLESSPSSSRISISTLTFLAFLLPTGVGTWGGEVSSATISLLTGISAVLAYWVFSLLPHENSSSAQVTAQNDLIRLTFW